jgi:AAA family ATP:ADP antiporter
MVARLRQFFDIRMGEGWPVLLSFLYIAWVLASFLLAKAIRSGLYLTEYGPYALVYVYAAVPAVLSLFVPAYNAIAARVGLRWIAVWTLVFFSLNVLAFWWAFTFRPFFLLTGLFYVWVNCFGVITTVQVWSFANQLLDTRQAKRLFGLIGSGASFGAIAGGLLARFLVRPIGGAINLMLVLAALILIAAVVVVVANMKIQRRGHSRAGRSRNRPLRETLREIAATPYLRHMAILVLLVSIVTQWTGLQLNVVVKDYFGDNANAITSFNGTFNFVLGSVSFLLQLFVASQALRRFGLAVTILALPISLGLGSALIVLIPGFLSVLVTNSFDQGLHYSVDRPTYELLYLPIPQGQRIHVKNAIDIVVTRIADALGAVVYGLVTKGFFFLPGLGLDLRGTAVLNVALVSVWVTIAWRLRKEYVRTIQDSIHRHRMDTERSSTSVVERSAMDALRSKLDAGDPADVRYALGLLEVQRSRTWHLPLRRLLEHPEADIRRRAMSLLSAAGDREIGAEAVTLLHDPDLGVRTEALLYLSREMGVDPLAQIEQLGDFEDFSIRAGMAAFLASPGRQQNTVAARAILESMVNSPSARERAEAARLIALVPDAFSDLLGTLIKDADATVALEAVRAARTVVRDDTIEPLLSALERPELTDEATGALARFGNAIIPEIETRLADERSDLEVRRELPSVLVRIGTVEAEQVLIDSLLHSDVTLRHRVITSLNKLRVIHPDVRLKTNTLELLLAAEIAGHYRSYQVLGPLRAQLPPTDPVVQAMQHSMNQELERIFRLMALLFPHAGLHDAYIGVQSSNSVVRSNALEFLDNILRPELRQVLVPVLDSSVTIDQRIALANRLVGAPLETPEQAVATLLASEDTWLRSCAVYAVGALQIKGLSDELDRLDDQNDPLLRDYVKKAKRRLAGEGEGAQPMEPPPAAMGMGVG